jgi:hypothetical protein
VSIQDALRTLSIYSLNKQAARKLRTTDRALRWPVCFSEDMNYRRLG